MKVILAAIAFLPIFSFAQLKPISLKPILDEFDLKQEPTYGIPLRNLSDVDFTGQSNRRVRIFSDIYPVHLFSSSPDGQWIALQFHNMVVPKNSNLEKKAVLASIRDGKAQVRKVIEPLPFHNMKNSVVAGFDFINDRILRVTVQGDKVGGGQYEYVRNYQFYDLATGETFKLSDDFGFGQVIDAREFSPYYYVVTGVLHGETFESAIHFDAVQKKFRVLRELPNENISRRIQHNPVDLPGRNVFRLSDDELIVQYGDEDVMHITGDRVRIGTMKDMKRSLGMPVENGGDRFSVKVTKDQLRIQSRHGKVLREYHDLMDDVMGPLVRVEGGFVDQMANHPHYGFHFLADSGEVIPLTPARFRLIFSDIHSTHISGLGNHNNETNELEYYAIPIPGVEIPTAHQQLKVEAPKAKEESSIVYRIGSGRYVIEQRNESQLVIMDIYMNELIREITLLDKNFLISENEESVFIEYPDKNQVVSYAKADFKKTETFDGTCNDILDELLKKKKK